ncbi:Trk system potassium transporter TrkA [bacterium]|nr:Trk system potassium transporter TrkA [bacterium]
MNIAIVGAGEIGAHLAKQLSSEKHQILVIEVDTKKLEMIEERMDIQTYQGNGSSVRVLEEVNISSFDLIICITDDDETNFVCSRIAKQLGVKSSIVRIKELKHFRNKLFYYKELFDIDHILSSHELTYMEICNLIFGPSSVAVENFAFGKVQMRRVIVDKMSKIINTPLKNLKIPKGLIVAAIFRGVEIIIPQGENTINPEDQVLIIGKTESVEKIQSIFGVYKHDMNKIVIVGGGEIGLGIASWLDSYNLNVKIIERNKDRAVELSKMLHNIKVILGDGIDLSLLKEEYAGDCDLFVSVTRDDEINLMSALLAKELGAKKTIAFVQKPDFAPLYQRLGLDVIISPRLLVAGSIRMFIEKDSFNTLAVIEDGKADIIQIEVWSKSKVTSTPLKDIDFPKGAIIGAIVRDRDVIVPTGQTILEAGDTVIIFSLIEIIPQIRKLFRV